MWRTDKCKHVYSDASQVHLLGKSTKGTPSFIATSGLQTLSNCISESQKTLWACVSAAANVGWCVAFRRRDNVTKLNCFQPVYLGN